MKLKRILSLLMAAALATAIAVPTAISSVSAAPIKITSAQKIEKFTVDLSSALTMSGSYMSIATFDKEIEQGVLDKSLPGSWKFATAPDGTKALELSYLPSKGMPNFRFMPYMQTGILSGYSHIRVEYMTEDLVPAEMVLFNNAVGTDKVILAPDTSISKGEWVVSPAVNVNIGTLFERMNSGTHFTIGVDSTTDTAKFYIRKINFFKSAADAYAYYGDKESDYVQTVFPLTLAGADVTGKPLTTNELWGKFTINNDDGTIDIVYADKTNFNGYNYMLKAGFNGKAFINPEAKYARLVYSAKNPAGTSGASLVLRNDAADERATLVQNLVDTDGFVLSDTVEIPQGIMERFSATGKYTACMHNTFKVKGVTVPGGEYRIKTLYFFTSKEEADAFVLPTEDPTTISINGNDISTYAIVTPAESVAYIDFAVKKLTDHIETLTGVKVPVYAGSCPETYNKILIGDTGYDSSDDVLKAVSGMENSNKRYAVKLVGNDIVLNSEMPFATVQAVDILLTSYLYYGAKGAPKKVTIDKLDYIGLFDYASVNESWVDFTNVADPTVFTEDFDSDEGYFTEENNFDDFVISGGKMSVKATESALTYVHVYEPNATAVAEFSLDSVNDGSNFGLMLRYNAEGAWIKAGYDFELGQYYIASREGMDFYSDYAYSKPMSLKAGDVVKLTLAVEGDGATLLVDDNTAVVITDITHVTPGRAAIYAEHVSLSVDNYSLTLCSGEGVIWQNVIHTKLPGDDYREGGTVIEMTDGSLTYFHHSGATFKSANGERTWSEAPIFTQTFGYTNIIRLNNGELLQIARGTKNGNDSWFSRTSKDDGKTWTDGGAICFTTYGGNTAASAGNMNDKLFQSPTTNRLFYCQNYEVRSGGAAVNGNYVFCEFYYSDDNGKTWKKSETDSWTIEGNDDTHFGECKILECADGTLRVYSSWNGYGCVVYSESKDNGVTWGPIQKMEELPAQRSSMQFVLDTYADDLTYYMVWVNTQNNPHTEKMSRGTLSLAMSKDGKSWTYLGDVWRWQNNYNNADGYSLTHIVDPFIKVTDDALIIGCGLSEHFPTVGTNGGHGSQRQHIWRIEKNTLPEGRPCVKYEYLYDFTDVKSTDTYYEAVKYAVDNGLFNGTSATTFDPAVTMNRAMFVTVLGRLDKADVSKYTTPTFDDVKAGEWYTSYVEWAAANGIVNGMGGGKYGVTGTITVEQACTILYRYNGGKTAVGDDVLGVPSVSDFDDASTVSAWAADGVKWAVENGIYAGLNGSLNPQSAASRALVATMFANYVRVIG